MNRRFSLFFRKGIERFLRIDASKNPSNYYYYYYRFSNRTIRTRFVVPRFYPYFLSSPPRELIISSSTFSSRNHLVATTTVATCNRDPWQPRIFTKSVRPGNERVTLAQQQQQPPWTIPNFTTNRSYGPLVDAALHPPFAQTQENKASPLLDSLEILDERGS